MYKTVLVPIDLDQVEQGISLVNTAMKFVKTTNCNLVLVHVTPEIPKYISTQIPESLFIKARDEFFKKLKEIAEIAGAGDQAEIIVREGSIHSEILTVAKDIEADLIIMASHQPEFSDYLLGTTAARVARHAKCSVLIARDI